MTSGTIETPDTMALDEWSRSRPHFVLVNKAIDPAPGLADLPVAMLARLEGRRPDFLVATREDLDRIGIVLSHEQLACFQRGEPILMVAGRVEHRQALKRGRRRKEEVERQVQDALAIQTYVGIERLCAWLRARDGRRLSVTVSELRDRVIDLLATEAWVDDLAATATASHEDRLAFFRTQADAGSRLVSDWYCKMRRPDDLSRVARQIVENSAQSMSMPAIEDTIQHELNGISVMVRCLRRSTTLVLTAHAVTVETVRRERMTKGQQAVFSGANSDRLSLPEAALAAFDGDFNPANLYGALLSYFDTFELARLIGRNGRGHDVRLDTDMVIELKRQISIRDELDAAALQPGDMPAGEQLAALMITKAAFELVPREAWCVTLDKAIETGDVVTLRG